MKSDIFGLKKKIEEVFSNDKSYVEEKYRRLYGTKGKEKTEAYGKNLKKKFMLFGIIGLLMINVSVVSYMADGNSNNLTVKNGEVSIKRPAEKEDTLYLDMKMTVDTGHGKVAKNLQIAVDPKNSGKNDNIQENEVKSNGEVIQDDIQEVVYSLNDDTGKSKVVLPSKLANGNKVEWEADRTSNLPIILAGLCLAFFFLYRSRFKGLDDEEKAASESIIRELPEFINKVILLLNAGIVLQTSFATIIEDRKKLNPDGDNYFYEQLGDIYMKVIRANGSFHEEFRLFSKRSGVRELMRVSNIISDNVEKGSDLVEKLSRESDALWFARKKQSEERGRVSETKLTFPLAILLMILVLITIAPAMIEM